MKREALRRWLGVPLLALVVAACTTTPAEPASTTAVSPLSSTTATTTTVPSTTSTTTLPPTTSTTVADPVERTGSLVEAFSAAWDAKDPDVLSSMYADEVKSYDATEGGVPVNKAVIDSVLHGAYMQGRFDVALTSYFVSGDGRFAATLGTFSSQDDSGNLVPQPYASLLAFENDKIVWVYDYYGGALSETEQAEPMLGIPPSVIEPGSPEAQTAVAETTATIQQWLAAYNARDAGTFLSFYAEEARYVDVVSPDWRVMTKSDLAEDVASHFPRIEFESTLEPSFGSAMGSFFVSADGRFAALQGSYKDAGMTIDRPMVVILEFLAGEIVQQYNFIAMDRALLQP